MKNRNKRWYEQKEELRAFMALIEALPSEIQCEIAIEILLKVSSLLDRSYENVTKDIAEYDPSKYKRWYDKNPNIHVAIESIKDLDEEKRDIIINDLSEIILKYYPQGELWKTF